MIDDKRKLLATCGELLHGETWKIPLKKDLSVNSSRIQKWLNKNSIPDGVWLDLYKLLDKHNNEIKKAQEAIKAIIGDLE